MKILPVPLLQKPFSTEEAIAQGISKASLTRLVQAGTLERLSRGVYEVTDTGRNTHAIGHDSGANDYSEQEKSYIVATLRCGRPSSVCLLSALEYYHVTDEITKHVWMLVPASKRVTCKDLKVIRSRAPVWNIGVIKTKDYWITTLERTLVDCLLNRRLVGFQITLAAIKQALIQKKVKLGKIYDVANSLGVAHRIRPMIEALGAL